MRMRGAKITNNKGRVKSTSIRHGNSLHLALLVIPTKEESPAFDKLWKRFLVPRNDKKPGSQQTCPFPQSTLPVAATKSESQSLKNLSTCHSDEGGIIRLG